MDGHERFRGEPVAAGAGELLGVEFDRQTGGVEMAAPTGREVERQHEIDAFGVGAGALVDFAGDGDDRRVGAQGDALRQPVGSRRLETPFQRDAAGGARDVAAKRPRRPLAYRAPRPPAGPVDLLEIEVALVIGIAAAIDQGVRPLAHEVEQLVLTASRHHVPARRHVEQAEDPSGVGIVGQPVRGGRDHRVTRAGAGEQRVAESLHRLGGATILVRQPWMIGGRIELRQRHAQHAMRWQLERAADIDGP